MTLQSKTNVVLAGLLIGLWLSSAVPSGASAQEAPARRDPAGARGHDEKKRTADPRREDRKRGGPQGEFRTDVPDHPLDIILGRPPIPRSIGKRWPTRWRTPRISTSTWATRS